MSETFLKLRLIEELLKDKEISGLGTEAPFLFGRRRADVICIRKNLTIGFEIKSANDKVDVLPKQLEDYRKYFDVVYTVCEPENLKKIRSVAPKWSGIVLIDDGSAKTLRKGQIFKKQNKLSLLSSVPSDALTNLINGKQQRKYIATFDMCKQLSIDLTQKDAKAISRKYIFEKYSKVLNQILNDTSGTLTKDDLVTLSKPPSLPLRRI
ncbi:sce7726 family protein [Alteromonas flava]|uniref:sce7726 family protein n=1 Tax=Alteromonas flava TaxID=2048003 RepID=UPI000C287823|nr:sce7726 family protein [Alteromonas flava]